MSIDFRPPRQNLPADHRYRNPADPSHAANRINSIQLEKYNYAALERNVAERRARGETQLVRKLTFDVYAFAKRVYRMSIKEDGSGDFERNQWELLDSPSMAMAIILVSVPDSLDTLTVSGVSRIVRSVV